MTDGGHSTVVFQALDLEAEIAYSERNLPHWFQTGAALFVTFREADSLPKEVIMRWHRDLRGWLQQLRLPVDLANTVLGKKSKNHDIMLNQLNHLQRREFKVQSDKLFHRSLDECHGACLLKHRDNASVVADTIQKFDGRRYDLDSFVVMPNHVHAIVQFREGFDLNTIGQSWMRFTAREINRKNGRKGVFWQTEPFDHVIRSSEQFAYLREYIADNPKKANLKQGDYLYWTREPM
jgi:putative transposase